MSQSLEEKVQYLLDRFEIQDVIARYGLGQDLHLPENDPSPADQWNDVFADDAIIDYSEVGFPPSVTVAELTTMMRGEDGKTGGMALMFSSWQHMEMYGNVTVDGDTATSITPHLHTHPLKDGEGNTLAAGIWHDKWERRPEGWRIVHRRLQDVYVQTLKSMEFKAEL